jgi:serine/threonine-protein kinase HipA
VTPAPRDLAVRHRERDVGLLAAGADGAMVFTYAPTWLDAEASFPVSLSLPLRAAPYHGGAAHAFFANLLPEGAVRQAVCRRLGISEANDLALLRAIGGECAGALTIVDPATATRPLPDDAYELLDDRRLQSLVSDDRVVPLLIGGETTRLSLAGAQDKVPVAVLDGRLHLPRGRSPSTHILKLPHRRYPHLPSNEAYVMGLAARIGLEAVEVALVDRTTPPSLLVERYDRRASDDPWPVTRLHQEDLCQALALPPTQKYEQEGGPTLVDVIELVRANVAKPVADVARVLEWQAFNVVAGNSDGHGKNLSILYDEDGPRLAPFYDLVSTRAYDALDRRLAMGIGGTRDPDQLARRRWTALAEELEVGARVVVEIAVSIAERALEAVGPWTDEFRAQHGDPPILQTLPTAIARRARTLRRALAAARS